MNETFETSVRQRLDGRRKAASAAVLLLGVVVASTLFDSSAVAQTTKKTSKKSSKKASTTAEKKSSKKSTTGSETTKKKTSEKPTTSRTATGETNVTKPSAGATTTIDVRPVTDSTTTSKKPASGSAGATSTTIAGKALKGPVFIPGAGRVLDIGANEVAKLANGGKVEADVRGASGLAASGTGTVIVDVTVTNPAQAGRVTLTPVAPDFARSVVASSVAFQPGSTTVSRVAVPVGSGGLVKVATTPGPSGLAVSVVGWVVNAPAGTSEPSAIAVEPCKILDTQTGLGGLQGEITPARPFDIPAVGVAKVPPALAASGPTPIAVILGVTGSGATGPLELRVVPTGAESPELKLQMNSGQTTTAHFIVPVGSDARSAFYVSSASTNIAVEVVGWLDREGLMKSGGPC